MDINFYNVYLNVALFGKPKEAVYYPNLWEGKIDTSGIMMLDYEQFSCEAAGAKDTWGVNFAQIEGDKGYIYVKDGFSDVSEVTVVTKASKETFNEQDDRPRWTYEIQNMTKLLLADDYDEIYRRLDTMLEVMEVLETSRKKAGIFFPGDEK